MARKKPQDEREQIGFRLPAALVDRLRDYCTRHNLVITSVVEDCLDEGLKSRSRKKQDPDAASSDLFA